MNTEWEFSSEICTYSIVQRTYTSMMMKMMMLGHKPRTDGNVQYAQQMQLESNKYPLCLDIRADKEGDVIDGGLKTNANHSTYFI